MENKETNRGKQLSIDRQFQKGVNIIDVDTTIANYMANVIIPDLEENGNLVKVPLIYGNAERWTGARKNGYLRDARGKIQIPLVMFKRNTIEKNESMSHVREAISMPFAKKYSSKNRYTKFSIMNDTKPVYEYYNITIPSYVTITYETIIWTSFTEHMNKIVEAFQNESEKYWGTVDEFKFLSRITSFDTSQEVADGTDRIIKTTFTTTVNAYLLPESFNNKPTIQKSFSPKRVVFGMETDLSGDLFTGATIYNEYADVINFVAIRGSQMATFVDGTHVKLINVKKPLLPSELVSVFNTDEWFKIYVNGDFISNSFYTYSYNAISKEITFSFSGLSYAIDALDEVAITGKFQEL